MAFEPIKVLIVDDSSFLRRALERIITNDSRLVVAGMATNGQEALEKVASEEFDVVILDIEMPIMDGLTALPQIIKKDPNLKVIIASTLTERNADISLKALSLGATDYIPKPSTSTVVNNTESFQRDLLYKVKNIGRLAQASRRRSSNYKTVIPTSLETHTPTEKLPPLPKREKPAEKPKKVETLQPQSPVKPVEKPAVKTPPAFNTDDNNLTTVAKPTLFTPKCLAIGSSTGGPNALFTVLKNFDKPLDVPIVITQHMPATFTRILADHIKQQTGYDAYEAEDGMLIEPGKAYVAPGDYHMTFSKEGNNLTAKIVQTEPVNFCRPSVDVMMESLIENVGPRSILGVMLTGMGADGLDTFQRLQKEGGCVIAQDKKTSVVWGMPGAVARAGICHKILPLNDIGNSIKGLMR